jgi:hypothetical protein
MRAFALLLAVKRWSLLVNILVYCHRRNMAREGHVAIRYIV